LVLIVSDDVRLNVCLQSWHWRADVTQKKWKIRMQLTCNSIIQYEWEYNEFYCLLLSFIVEWESVKKRFFS
jgi:hypothetical protein